MAQNSNNEIVRMAASNEQVQGYVGDSVAALSSNRQVQQAVANTLANAAEDRETQKKVANAVWSGAKSSTAFAGDVVNAAAKSYMESE